MTNLKVFVTACGVSLAAFALGMAAMLRWGREIPGWLLTLFLAIVMAMALIYGFTDTIPRLDWLRTRPVRGAALICLGVAAVFMPLAFVVSALCIGIGTRLAWASACELEAEARSGAEESAAAVAAEGWKLVREAAPAGELEAQTTLAQRELAHAERCAG